MGYLVGAGILLVGVLAFMLSIIVSRGRTIKGLEAGRSMWRRAANEHSDQLYRARARIAQLELGATVSKKLSGGTPMEPGLVKTSPKKMTRYEVCYPSVVRSLDPYLYPDEHFKTKKFVVADSLAQVVKTYPTATKIITLENVEILDGI